jgi:hypothetical protein
MVCCRGSNERHMCIYMSESSDSSILSFGLASASRFRGKMLSHSHKHEVHELRHSNE